MNDLLYAGTHGHVVAIDAASGAEVWRTRLSRGASFVSLIVAEDRIYAGHYGQCFCLHRLHGEILWHNNLPKTGYHIVLLAERNAASRGGLACPQCGCLERLDARFCSQCGMAMTETRARSRAHPLYVTLNGFVLALDRRTGRELWRYRAGRGYGSPVSLLFAAHALYVGCSGHVYSVSVADGTAIWTNDLPRLSYGVVSLAMPGAVGTDPGQLTLAARVKSSQDAARAGGAGAAGS